MGLLNQLKDEYKTVSIVGMAKNAGKTTALNYLIEEAMDEGMILGITSTGRDGETNDLVTSTDKPKVYLEEGTLVTVPTQLYDLAEGGLEILKMTKYGSSIGQIMLCRVADSGYVQIAGPVANADTKKISEEMILGGAEVVIVDGAIDRKSIASPETSDAIILATGAVLSRSMNRVVSETAHVVALYSLPEVEDEQIKAVAEKIANKNLITIINKNDYKVLDLKTGLNNSRFINEELSDDTLAVFVPGAFTKSVIEDISPSNLKKVKFILKDPTKIFMDSIVFPKMLKKGLKIEVLENIKVVAVTVNPVAPAGYSFDHLELVEAMERALPHIHIVDVKL